MGRYAGRAYARACARKEQFASLALPPASRPQTGTRSRGGGPVDAPRSLTTNALRRAEQRRGARSPYTTLRRLGPPARRLCSGPRRSPAAQIASASPLSPDTLAGPRFCNGEGSSSASPFLCLCYGPRTVSICCAAATSCAAWSAVRALPDWAAASLMNA